MFYDETTDRCHCVLAFCTVFFSYRSFVSLTVFVFFTCTSSLLTYTKKKKKKKKEVYLQLLCSPIRNFISICRIGSETIHADEIDFSVMLSFYACCVTRESELISGYVVNNTTIYV